MAFFEFMSQTDVVRILLRDGTLLLEIHHARGGDLRQIEVRLRGLEVGLRLLELMIHFRCFDLGEKIARLDARADIGVPLLQISVGARIDGRIDQRLRISRAGPAAGSRPSLSDG